MQKIGYDNFPRQIYLLIDICIPVDNLEFIARYVLSNHCKRLLSFCAVVLSFEDPEFLFFVHRLNELETNKQERVYYFAKKLVDK